MKREPPEALFYEREPQSDTVRCNLCAQHCRIRNGLRGVCRVRENQGGTLRAMAYGLLLAMSVDPIEKKPLAHFLPGSRSLSIASAGCNLSCPWCQNSHLSDALRSTTDIEGDYVAPEQVVEEAVRRECASISYTYSEPTIHYEHNRAVGVLGRAKGVRSVLVTNGLMTPEAARDAARSFLDAANVDLKAMRPETYRRHCQGPLDAVLECIRTLHAEGVWIEVTTLVIPGLNDDEGELRDAAKFIRSVSAEVPWHLSRYHPAHRWHDAPRTPAQPLRRAREIGLNEGLHYVYTGNVWGDEGEHTYCPNCHQIVMQRHGFEARPVGLARGKCTRCQTPIAGVQMP